MDHLERYERDLAIRFLCGGVDHHVPPDDAQNFRRHLITRDPEAQRRIVVDVQADAGHLDVDDGWYDRAAGWLTAP
jgi:hypothetical protein